MTTQNRKPETSGGSMDYPGSHSKAAWKAALALLCCAGLVQAQQSQQTQAPQVAREQNAATQGQNRKTESANRAAAVEDETNASAQAARTTQSETAQFEAQARRNGSAAGAPTPSYGPVLRPRGQQAQDPARKDPAEVHDETDSLSRQIQPKTQPQSPSQSRQPARQTTNPNLRRPAWQPATEPMAPRPLRSADGATPAVPVPVPVPATPPRPVAPSTAIIGSCQGSACTDVGGNRINGIGSGNAGVSGSGRLCTRTGTSVQCF
jgi:hypothetical protein